MRIMMQQKFDRETDHSKIPEKELEWENYVEQQLNKYERWK